MRVLVGLVLMFVTAFTVAAAQTGLSPAEASQADRSQAEASQADRSQAEASQAEASQAETPLFDVLFDVQTFRQFLATLQNHPAVRAQAALVGAAEAQLEAVYSPVSFSASANYTRLNLDLPDPPPGEASPNIPSTLVGLTLAANFRPFVFGDTADLARTRQIELEKAKLAYRETLSALQAQALGAAVQVAVAEASLNLATEGRTLTERALAATRVRRTKGAAAAGEVRTVELQLRAADNRLLSAQTSLDIARRNLVNLVGEADAPGPYRLEPVSGTPPELRRAQLDLALAQVGAAGTQRALYPTAQASYTWPLGDAKSELSVSVESRTLQPGLSYSYANPRQSAAGFSAPEGVPASALKSSFTVGVALNISPEAFGALQTADARVAAAGAALAAALDNAELTALSLRNTYQTARLALELAQQGVNDARATLQDLSARLDLGLATELEVSQAEFDLAQARLDERAAEFDLLQAALDTYRSYAVPILPAPEAQP